MPNEFKVGDIVKDRWGIAGPGKILDIDKDGEIHVQGFGMHHPASTWIPVADYDNPVGRELNREVSLD